MIGGRATRCQGLFRCCVLCALQYVRDERPGERGSLREKRERSKARKGKKERYLRRCIVFLLFARLFGEFAPSLPKGSSWPYPFSYFASFSRLAHSCTLFRSSPCKWRVFSCPAVKFLVSWHITALIPRFLGKLLIFHGISLFGRRGRLPHAK